MVPAPPPKGPAMRRLPLVSLVVALFAGAPAALALDCRPEAEAELRRLGIDASEIAEVRYIEKLNPTERGPDVLGVRGWIRLHACDGAGYLVIDMTRSCLVRQSYTRGDCRLPGVTGY